MKTEGRVKFNRELSEKRHTEKGTCLECGAETENAYYIYCSKHYGKCRSCGKRCSLENTLCEECLNKTLTKKCERCGNSFNKNCNRQKYCSSCAKEIRKEQDNVRKKRWKNNQVICYAARE